MCSYFKYWILAMLTHFHFGIYFPLTGFYQVVINSTCLFCCFFGEACEFIQRVFAHFSYSMIFLSISQVSLIRSISQAIENGSVFQIPKLILGCIALCHLEVFWEFMFVLFDVLHSTVHGCHFLLLILVRLIS